MLKPDTADAHAAARNALRRWFQEYTNESEQLQSLLRSLSEETSEVRLRLIEDKQKRVDAARERYHAARDEYTRDVLGTMACSGRSGLF